MILDFRHKGLKRAYEQDKYSKVPPDLVKRVSIALSDLDSAQSVSDMNLSRYQLHPLKGVREGLWSIRISGNWRMVFRFEDGDAYDVDLVDYH